AAGRPGGARGRAGATRGAWSFGGWRPGYGPGGPGGQRGGRSQGFSIIDTICTASWLMFFCRAVVIDSPTSGTKLATDDTTTGPGVGGTAPGGRSASTGMGSCFCLGCDRISPVRRSRQVTSTVSVVSASRTSLSWLRLTGILVKALIVPVSSVSALQSQ